MRLREFEFANRFAPEHSHFVMSDRDLVLDAVKDMPATATMEQIVDELLLLDVVKKRLAQNPRGKGVPAEELLAQVSSWVTK